MSLRRSSRSSGRASTSYTETQDSDDSDAEMGQEEDPEASAEEEEEEEAPESAARSRRSVGSVRSEKSTAPPRASRGSASQASIAGEDAVEDEEADIHSQLYNALDNNTMPNAVQEWLDRYEANQDEAILELINLVLEVADCAGELNELPAGEEDIAEVVEDLKEQFEGTGEYILDPAAKSKAAKKKLANFQDLWNKLMVQGSNRVIGEGQKLLTVLIDWLIKLASSEVRPLRHVSTMVALDFLQACIDVANKTKQEQGTAHRQLQTEKKKKKSNETKLRQLDERITSSNDNIESLENTMQDLFDGIFVHRYRDVFAPIRVMCLSKLADFISEYPSHFLKDNFLKYLGWQLHDKDEAVRTACLTAVTQLYQNEENHTQLDLFTTRFKARMLEMQLDIKTDVGVKAMELSAALLKTDVMENEEIGETLGVLKHNEPKMRHAAADFVQSYMELYPDISGKLRVLLSVCETDETEDDSSYLYVAESMWETAPVLKEWDGMVELLQIEDGEDALDEKEQRRLVGLMTGAVMKASGETLDDSENKLNKKQREAIPGNVDALTGVFMTSLPALMERFQADEAIMSELVKIPSYLDVTQYAVQRKKKNLSELVKHLRTAYTKHNDDRLLCNVAEAFSTLTKTDFALHKECKPVLDKLVDQLTTELGRQVDVVMGGEADDQEGAEYSLEVTLRRLGALSHQLDVRSPDALESVKSCIATGADEEQELSESVCSAAISVMHDYCMWDVIALQAADVREKEIKSAAARRDEVLAQLVAMEAATDAVKLEAFTSLTDLLAVYRQVAQQVQGPMEGFALSDEMQDSILGWFEREMDSAPDGDKASYIKCLAQAVTNGGLPMQKFGPAVVAHFVKHNVECEKLIKEFTKEMKKKLPTSGVWSIELGAMKSLFTQYRDGNSGEKVFDDLKDLAEKVASAYPMIMKDKTHLSFMISGGIKYALEDSPSNLPFLEAAVPPLAKQCNLDQKQVIMQFLEERMREKGLVADEDDEDWASYFELKNLLQNKKDAGGNSNRRKKATSRRTLMGDFDENEASDEAEMASEADDDDLDDDGFRSLKTSHRSSSGSTGGSEGRRASGRSSRASRKRSSLASQKEEEEVDDEEEEDEEEQGEAVMDEADAEEVEEEEEPASFSVSQDTTASSQGFKPKLRVSSGSVPGRGSGFAGRNKRRRR